MKLRVLCENKTNKSSLELPKPSTWKINFTVSSKSSFKAARIGKNLIEDFIQNVGKNLNEAGEVPKYVKMQDET